MQKQYVALRRTESFKEPVAGRKPDHFLISYGDWKPTLAEAKADATKKASRSGEWWYVAEIVGVERPVYDVEIGWEPAE